MVFLLFSILCTLLIGVIFLLFRKYRINTFEAIVWNYLACVCVGSLVAGGLPRQDEVLGSAWFPYTLLLGMFFIGGFTIVGHTTQRHGMAVANVMQKLSILFSIPFSIWLLQESLPLSKVFGLGLALCAIPLTSLGGSRQDARSNWVLPVLTLVISALIEIILLFIEKQVSPSQGNPWFVSLSFGWAGLAGMLVLSWQGLVKKQRLELRNVAGGIALGIPNYFSIYFLMRALGSVEASSKILAFNNIGIIVLSGCLGFLVFREPFSRKRLLGMVLAIGSILILSYQAL